MSTEQDGCGKHETINDRIAKVERLENRVLHSASDLVKRNNNIYWIDLFVFGALKRTLAKSAGFRTLIMEKTSRARLAS